VELNPAHGDLPIAPRDERSNAAKPPLKERSADGTGLARLDPRTPVSAQSLEDNARASCAPRASPSCPEALSWNRGPGRGG
jgi:hypothetical protein